MKRFQTADPLKKNLQRPAKFEVESQAYSYSGAGANLLNKVNLPKQGH
ncbi:MAG TPA: hypothetical protein VLA15_09785 [Desulfurivibrionaceae bacterium]|nr:hypothetical protein [Desulfurivibrionaceae bacterium]